MNLTKAELQFIYFSLTIQRKGEETLRSSGSAVVSAHEDLVHTIGDALITADKYGEATVTLVYEELMRLREVANPYFVVGKELVGSDLQLKVAKALWEISSGMLLSEDDSLTYGGSILARESQNQANNKASGDTESREETQPRTDMSVSD